MAEPTAPSDDTPLDQFSQCHSGILKHLGSLAELPSLIEPEEAAAHILAGLTSSRFEIAFPRGFISMLKLLRLLPYRLYFPLVARRTGVS